MGKTLQQRSGPWKRQRRGSHSLTTLPVTNARSHLPPLAPLTRSARYPPISNTVRGCVIFLVLHKLKNYIELANGCWVAPDDMWLLTLSSAAKPIKLSLLCLTGCLKLKMDRHANCTVDPTGCPCTQGSTIFIQGTG